MAWSGKNQALGLKKRREIQARHDWEIRKRIELYRAQGMGQRRIAKALTERGVETPRLFGGRVMQKRGAKPQNEWTPSAVARIMKRLGMATNLPPLLPPGSTQRPARWTSTNVKPFQACDSEAQESGSLVQAWNDAVQTLFDVQAGCQVHLENMADGHCSSWALQKLEEICGYDLNGIRIRHFNSELLIPNVDPF